MSARERIAGTIIGALCLALAVVEMFIVPEQVFANWGLAFGAVFVLAMSLWRWRCDCCLGKGWVPSAVLAPNGRDILPATATCDWCGGDGKGRR